MHAYVPACTRGAASSDVGRPDDSLHHHGTEHVRTKDAEKRDEARSGLREDAIVTFCSRRRFSGKRRSLQPSGDARIAASSRTVG